MVKTMERRLRTSESLVAGVSAMLVATAFLGLVYLVQPSFPFPPLGLAQRLLRLVPGPVAVFFIDRLGHWALRLFAVGFTVGSVLAGGVAGVVVARRPAPTRARAAWLAGGLLAAASSPATGRSRGRPRCWSMARWSPPPGSSTRASCAARSPAWSATRCRPRRPGWDRPAASCCGPWSVPAPCSPPGW